MAMKDIISVFLIWESTKQDILTRDFSPGNSDAMDILTLGLELGRQNVPGLKNTGVNFLASGCRGPRKARPGLGLFQQKQNEH